jgi:hypothetical protein
LAVARNLARAVCHRVLRRPRCPASSSAFRSFPRSVPPNGHASVRWHGGYRQPGSGRVQIGGPSRRFGATRCAGPRRSPASPSALRVCASSFAAHVST